MYGYGIAYSVCADIASDAVSSSPIIDLTNEFETIVDADNYFLALNADDYQIVWGDDGQY